MQTVLYESEMLSTKILQLSRPRHRCRNNYQTQFIWLIDEIEAYSRPI